MPRPRERSPRPGGFSDYLEDEGLLDPIPDLARQPRQRGSPRPQTSGQSTRSRHGSRSPRPGGFSEYLADEGLLDPIPGLSRQPRYQASPPPLRANRRTSSRPGLSLSSHSRSDSPKSQAALEREEDDLRPRDQIWREQPRRTRPQRTQVQHPGGTELERFATQEIPQGNRPQERSSNTIGVHPLATTLTAQQQRDQAEQQRIADERRQRPTEVRQRERKAETAMIRYYKKKAAEEQREEALKKAEEARKHKNKLERIRRRKDPRK